jgi:protein O-mannosyl-transferase
MTKATERRAGRVSLPGRENDGGARVSPLLAALGLVVLAFAVYLPALQGGFLWDDGEMVYKNPFVHAPDGLYDIWFTRNLSTYFPLTSSMFWLEWRLWGESPYGYRIVNVLLHALSAVVLWRIFRRLRIPGAFVAAAVFAVHPVTVASAAWIAERKNTLSLLLGSSALLAFLRFEDEGRRIWYAAALAAFVLALLAKTSVVMLPVVMLVLAWYRRDAIARAGGAIGRAGGAIGRADVLRTLPFFAAAVVLGGVTVAFQHQATARPESLESRVAATGWAFWFYLGKVVAPVRLSMIYPRWNVDPTWLPAWIPLVAVVALVALCWHRRAGWGRPVLTALGVFAAMLLPVLGLVGWSFQEHSLVSDHLQYVALAGPIALVIGSAAEELRRQQVERRAAAALALVPVAALSTLTWARTHVFENEWTLWEDTLAKNPAAWAAHNNLGRQLADIGRFAEAKGHYLEALRLHPDYAHAHNNLGVVLVTEGHDAEAERHYRESLRLEPANAEAHSNLGNLLIRTARSAEAVEQQREAARLQPDSAEIHTNLGNGLTNLGRYDEALAEYDLALRLRPDLAPAFFNRGKALLETGRPAEAVQAFEAALRIAPNLEVARQALAVAQASAAGANVRQARRVRGAGSMVRDSGG